MDLKSKPFYILSRGPDLTLNATNLLATKLKQQGFNIVSKPIPKSMIIVSDLVADKPLKEWFEKNNLQQTNFHLVSVRWARQVIITKKIEAVLDPYESRWIRKLDSSDQRQCNKNVQDLAKPYNQDLATNVLPQGFPDAFRQSALALTELCELHNRNEAFAMQRIPLKYREKASAIGALPVLLHHQQSQPPQSRHKRQVLAPI